MDALINNRIGKAFASFAKLCKNVIQSDNLRLATRMAVYRANIVSVLLYGLEAMTVHKRHLRLLKHFHIILKLWLRTFCFV